MKLMKPIRLQRFIKYWLCINPQRTLVLTAINRDAIHFTWWHSIICHLNTYFLQCVIENLAHCWSAGIGFLVLFFFVYFSFSELWPYSKLYLSQPTYSKEAVLIASRKKAALWINRLSVSKTCFIFHFVVFAMRLINSDIQKKRKKKQISCYSSIPLWFVARDCVSLCQAVDSV